MRNVIDKVGKFWDNPFEGKTVHSFLYPSPRRFLSLTRFFVLFCFVGGRGSLGNKPWCALPLSYIPDCSSKLLWLASNLGFSCLSLLCHWGYSHAPPNPASRRFFNVGLWETLLGLCKRKWCSHGHCSTEKTHESHHKECDLCLEASNLKELPVSLISEFLTRVMRENGLLPCFLLMSHQKLQKVSLRLLVTQCATFKAGKY